MNATDTSPTDPHKKQIVLISMLFRHSFKYALDERNVF